MSGAGEDDDASETVVVRPAAPSSGGVLPGATAQTLSHVASALSDLKQFMANAQKGFDEEKAAIHNVLEKFDKFNETNINEITDTFDMSEMKARANRDMALDVLKPVIFGAFLFALLVFWADSLVAQAIPSDARVAQVGMAFIIIGATAGIAYSSLQKGFKELNSVAEMRLAKITQQKSIVSDGFTSMLSEFRKNMAAENSFNDSNLNALKMQVNTLTDLIDSLMKGHVAGGNPATGRIMNQVGAQEMGARPLLLEIKIEPKDRLMSDHQRTDARILQNSLVEFLSDDTETLESLLRSTSTSELGSFRALRFRRVPNREDMRLEDVLISFWMLDLRFALLVSSTSKQTEYYLLVESLGSDEEGHLATIEAVKAIYESKCPGVILDDSASVEYSQALLARMADGARVGGILTGIPSRKTNQVDEVLRSMRGEECSYLVVGVPLSRTTLKKTEEILMEEIQSFRALGYSADGDVAAHDEKDDPYVRESMDALYADLDRVRTATISGMWNVSVYISASSGSAYAKLASVMKGSLVGEDSLPEPIRITSINDSLMIALRQLIEHPAVLRLQSSGNSLGIFDTPSLCTPLTSEEFSVVAGFPDEEVSGLEVFTPPKYSVNAPADGTERSLVLGEILDRNRPSGNHLTVKADNLVKHGFVVGQTGYGKTRAVLRLLKELNAINVPWLVIDPVGKEYRTLIEDGNKAGIRLFNLGMRKGDQRDDRFRFNPFDVPPKVPVQTHVEMVTSVLEMAFSSYTVLPQLLQIAVVGAYQRKGWNLSEDDGSAGKMAPTLTDLYIQIRGMRIEYPADTSSELRQALLTRIRGLMLGSKGTVLNCQRSIPLKYMLDHPSILELEGMQDPNDKAIVMGLFFGTVAEYVRWNSDYSGSLKHVVVLEEAHNILPNIETDVNTAFQGHPKAKMVETMSNMLAEMRKHGEGIMIVNQIPSELSARAVKNTNLSLIFRTKDARDKQMLADSINLGEDQRDFLSNLMPGEAIAFTEDLHHPVMIEVTKTDATLPSESQVQKWTEGYAAELAEIFSAVQRPLVGCEFCAEACQHFLDGEQAFRNLAQDKALFARFTNFSNEQNYSALGDLIEAELNHSGFENPSAYKKFCVYVHFLKLVRDQKLDSDTNFRIQAKAFEASLTGNAGARD